MATQTLAHGMSAAVSMKLAVDFDTCKLYYEILMCGGYIISVALVNALAFSVIHSPGRTEFPTP